MTEIEKISPSFKGENAKRVMLYVERVRKETKLPDLSVAQALMRLVNNELGSDS